jgi:hypothetical protein
MTFWIEPAHDSRRVGFFGRAGKMFWLWRFTVYVGKLPMPRSRSVI